MWSRHDDGATEDGATDQRAVAKHFIAVLDRYHGQATGVFTGDESLAGLNPSQGTELCAVVEYMFSLETLLSAFGDVEFADRLERIAFNALPATFKPDMWAHQYDQQANQVVCKICDEHIYTNNSGDANIYGLEPNFGCCTANMHQGWPKFASHLWMRSPDGGITALAYAPCVVETKISGQPVRVEVNTNYPFDETIEITVSAPQPIHFALRLRVPTWSEGATVTIGDEESTAQAGTFHTTEREWHGDTTTKLRLPMSTRFQSRFNGAVAIEHGPLLYALQIGEEWKQVRGEAPHADWEVHPTTPWNYALKLTARIPTTADFRVGSRPPRHPVCARRRAVAAESQRPPRAGMGVGAQRRRAAAGQPRRLDRSGGRTHAHPLRLH